MTATAVRYGDKPGVGKTEVILRQTTRYDDNLVAIPVAPSYRSWEPDKERDEMMVIGTQADTTEGRLRAELVHLLARAVGEAGRQPGASHENTKVVRELVEEAYGLAVKLDEDHGENP